MSVTHAALMCHAPIVVPGVAGPDEARRCRHTTRAMAEVAARIVAAAPDRLVLISPHTPRSREGFGVLPGPRHRGDLADFRTPQVAVDLPDAPEVAAHLRARGVPLVDLDGRPDWLDHGAVVPLSFLWEAGWRGPTAIIALPWAAPAPTAAGAEALGRALRDLPGATAVLASGDMSHRLKPGAPAGHHPRAAEFDAAFVAALRAEDWSDALHAEPRDVAAEDVVDSTHVAMAAAGTPLHAEVLSYEGPWGVGYTEAILHDPAPPRYAVARRAIARLLHGQRRDDPVGGGPARGVFVTLHTGPTHPRPGELRGCIGHMGPTCDSLWEEIATVARLAATRDPRFPPVRAEELPDLTVEVSVLSPTTPVEAPATLDPRVHGLEVTAGTRRGVLLPDLDGVDTVAQQIAICRQKAGIGPHEPVDLACFTVDKEVQP